MKKLTVGVAAFVVVVIAAGVLWWHRGDRRPADSLVLHGNVDIRQVSLAFEGSGRVAEMRVEEGQQVNVGFVVAVLDTRTLRLQLDQARAQADAQQQTLLRLRHGSRPEEINQARSRLSAATADAERADQDLSRLRGIAVNTKGRGVSRQDLDRAGAASRIARARVSEQRDALRLAELGPRTEDVTGADAHFKAAQAQVALLQHQIELGELKAPTDAVVRSRLLEPGDMATPQRPVFALALTHPKWVRVYVGEPDLGRLKPGMAARVWTDSFPGQPLSGKIGAISPSAEFTPKSVQTEELRTSLVYEVRVVVDDPDDVLRLGQPASVRLATGELK
jgi:HlyD family secretion protein